MKAVYFKNVDMLQSEKSIKLIEKSSNAIRSSLNKVKDKYHDKTVEVPFGIWIAAADEIRAQWNNVNKVNLMFKKTLFDGFFLW